MPSVKKNFLYSSVLTIAGYIFPILTFPYVTRVLGVENLGLVNFIDSVINYLILLSTLGISITGIRAIAAAPKDRQALSRIFSSLLSLTLIFTAISVAILVVLAFTVPDLMAHRELMWIGASKLIFNSLLIEWFFKGLEDFKFITLRSLAIKLLYVIAIFAFVRHRNDYPTYYTITCFTVVINALVNCTYARKFTRFSFRNIEIKPYIKPFLSMGFYLILVSTYSTLNVAILGFATNETQVGYFTTATKLYGIVLALFTAFTGVMLPRMTSLIAEGRTDEFISKVNQSIRLLILFSIPIIIFCEFYATDIISIIAGSGYAGAIVPMQIVMLLVFVVGSEQVFIIQILMPLKKDKELVINNAIAAVFSLVLNALLVSKLQSIGSAVVVVGSETLLMFLSLRIVKKHIQYKYPLSFLIKTILSFVPLGVMLYLSNRFISNIYISAAVGIMILGVYSLSVVLTIFKNEYLAVELSKRLSRLPIKRFLK